MDNHLFRDVVYRPYGADGVRPIPTKLQELGSQVWNLGLQAARLAPREVSQIFTAYHPDRESSRASAERIRAVAVDRDAVYVPVWLECDVDELARRMALPERRERAKLRDPVALRENLAALGSLPPPPGAIVLDTAQLTPADAALLIAAHAGALF
nr:hypothetical protein [Deinococcus sp. HSC-46F16]